MATVAIVLTRLAYGGRVSLRIAVLSAFGIFFLGGVIGLIAGYVGGMTDAISHACRRRRPLDSRPTAADPDLLALLAGSRGTGPRPGLRLVARYCAPHPRRGVGPAAARLRRAPRTHSAPHRVRIVLRHILPNLVPLLVVYTSLSLPGLMLAETGLSFLGIGVQVPTPSWGNMLGDGQQFFRTNIQSGVHTRYDDLHHLAQHVFGRQWSA